MFEEELSTLSTADLLESAAEERAAEYRSAARSLVHAVAYADRFHPDASPDRPGRRASDGRERAVVLGGEGCPPVMEFCIAEYGAVLGVSPGVARDYLANALALRHRFPFVWARVLAEDITAWKARNLARDCEKLSLEAALYVDQRVAHLLDTISPTRLAKIIKAAKMHADPAQAKAEADEKTRERGVWVGQSDEHGTKTCVIKAASAAVRRHKAKIDEIADALLAQGDKRSIQARRAEAVGIMPDTAYTNELIAQAQQHQHNTPTPNPTPAPDSRPAPDPTPASDPAPASAVGPAPASNPAFAAGPSPTRASAPTPASAPTTASASTPAPTSTPARASAIDPTPAPDSEPASAAISDPAGSPRNVAAGNGMPADRASGVSPDPGRHVTSGPDNETGPDNEPGPDDEADREAPHPGESDLPDPLDHCDDRTAEPFDRASGGVSDAGESMTPDELHALAARLAQIKRDAHARPPGDRPTPARPGKTEIYVHLTDHTLTTGTGVLRAEDIGPLLATQLTELVGHGPYLVKPVIDLNKAISSDAYETTNQIREHVKLTHPTELFPYGTRETTNNIDLDHIQPYNPLGPPGQTNTQNLIPLSRYGHRVKTHAPGWKVRRIDPKTIEWTTPHGFVLHVNPTGTHRVPKEDR
ncbi:hypothetical protein GCM10009745_12880 [Kribbella yunnanensis]|uniref:DUF222 domain-containing protein n=1 Tax=Kribbella yunnanensis TaxID=190194 RepID=A0ABN2GI14_9ACTN